MNSIQNQDIQEFVSSFSLSNLLGKSIFLITGATGLIGATLVHCLLALKKEIFVYAPIRDNGKLKTLFSEEEQLHIKGIPFDFDYSSVDIDYIVHCAAPTDGKYMQTHPVETFDFIVDSTRTLLDVCSKKTIKSMVFVSSLESYGQIKDERVLKEDDLGYIDMSSPRSSYPVAKRATEFCCLAYFSEYGIPVKVARLTQTFGAGILATDNRVFAQFARSIVAGKDIVLHTMGRSAKPYCYSTDCVSAILYVLLKGENGQIYNVATPGTFISIMELANFLRKEFNPAVNVVIESNKDYGYAPETSLNLSVEKLLGLGWNPRYDLKRMFKQLIDSLQNNEN
jgi:nucleoside-diphosphate-sugar epimerase